MSVDLLIAPYPLNRIAPDAARPASLTTQRVCDTASRLAALAIVEQVYREEKGWLADADGELPESALDSPTSSWFLARCGEEPAGVVRLTATRDVERGAVERERLVAHRRHPCGERRQVRIAQVEQIGHWMSLSSLSTDAPPWLG